MSITRKRGDGDDRLASSLNGTEDVILEYRTRISNFVPSCLRGLLLAAFCAACGPAPLHDTHASPDAVAVAILEALTRNDEATLRRLALDESEFRAHVWPSLPAARPERNLPFSYIWGDLRQKSEAGLKRTLATHGGRRYQLGRVLLGRMTEYAGFRTHEGTRLLVGEGGREPFEIRVCGSLLEQPDGQWKVFSYVVDD